MRFATGEVVPWSAASLYIGQYVGQGADQLSNADTVVTSSHHPAPDMTLTAASKADTLRLAILPKGSTALPRDR